jgi:aspartyl/asparaginyl beta-hydroxylase (cupin superfamily)
MSSAAAASRAAAGFAAPPGSSAARPAATLVRSGMLRTTAAHRPAPSLFYYPGLTSRPRWDPETFPWLRPLVSAVPEIAREYQGMKAKVPSDYSLKKDEHTLHGGGSWDWHSFILKGRIQSPFQVLAPNTASLLQQQVPDLLVGPPFAYAFFSTLGPGTKIAPHYGPCNIRLRVHLPLIVPANASSGACGPDEPGTIGMRIAGETVRWEAGRPVVFDDTYEHEVWNTTSEDRVVLLFDVWHPELSQGEREAVVGMFDEARSKGWVS